MALAREIRVNHELTLPVAELELSASRSSGPGGQHVNKTESRVTLHFDVEQSPSLTDGQRRRLRERLPTRITRDGVLVMHCQKHRSQAANRAELLERLEELLREALRRRRPRRRTRPTKRSKERRLQQKQRRGRLKRERSGGHDDGG